MPIPLPSNAKRAYTGEFLEIWQWQQERFDGSHATFECVVLGDVAHVIPFLDAKTVLFLQQEQPGRLPFVDVPGGRVDGDESVLEAAKRELHEETGYEAGTWLEWTRNAHHGISRREETIFLARDIRNGSGQHLDAGEKIELRPTRWDDLVRMCLRHELRQPKIMLAILAMEFDSEAKERLRGWLK